MRLAVLLFLLFGFGIANGQVAEMNQVRPGKIGISIYYMDTLLNIGSNKLNVYVNDQTEEIVIRLNPSSLRTGIDSLDQKLRDGFMNEVVFKGSFGLSKLWETGQLPRSFEMEGEMTIEGITSSISMNGSVQQSQQGMGINGLLYLHFDPELHAFGLDEKLPEFADFGCVEILQPISIANSRQ